MTGSLLLCTRTDKLFYTNDEKKNSLLSWLRQPPGVISLKNFYEILDRLEFVQNLDLPLDNGKEIHQNRLIGVEPHAHQLKDGYKINFCSFELKPLQMGASY